MSKFNIKNSINSFSTLGKQLITPDAQLMAIIEDERYHNAWFTPESVLQAVTAIGKMLKEEDLQTWLSKYNLDNDAPGKKVGLILAGNIPLVGFHDVLCVLASGNHALIKSSSQDARLIKTVLERLVAIDDSFTNQYSFIERLADFDAVIATGSNNSSRYFDYYFGKVPNIIRKNRNSIALLTGDETAEQLFKLGHDIFDYYGLGCRNVSKLLVPKDYNFNFFFESIEDHKAIIHHHKYNNNYDYNKSIYLVNSDKHLDNGFLMVKEDDRLASPLAVLYFSYYDNLAQAQELFQKQSDNIQCIVTNAPINVASQVVSFGQSQHPELWDYADGIDTMEFLSNL
ncbi:acyl-CoA reductase [Mucilaginibacter ginsenosidivorax]|uniref:Acyl-CoA reductase n=1 Tax=Mucilaginibacter ginsenosidivorax TaxID=862126 RepID=A0A5B8W7P8_9SPHI|nr:acyl-CoA reductase [Mucilaginibacter ginsenosidivorax]QEC79773.1 acyl-CoA reductase [Mucilaginibacter ginsenosidivorax]